MLNRRGFIKYSTAVTSLALLPEAIFADEKNKQKLAKYTFKFSSPYKTNDYKVTPHAHLEIKQLIEKHTNNNIYVEIRDNGIDGIGSSLANSVRHGKTNCALISVSNLTPRIPELDILNIPFGHQAHKSILRSVAQVFGRDMSYQNLKSIIITHYSIMLWEQEQLRLRDCMENA